MLTLLTLSLICLVSIPILLASMILLSIPLAIIFGLLPWLLRLATVVLLLRALLDQPFRVQSLLPAAIAFSLSLLLR